MIAYTSKVVVVNHEDMEGLRITYSFEKDDEGNYPLHTVVKKTQLFYIKPEDLGH